MKTLELEDQQVEALIKLVERKIEGNRWVLDNKDPNNPDKLKKNIEKLKSILEKLKSL